MNDLKSQISTFKTACEANIVGCLWKNPQLFYEYDFLELDDFCENVWKVYWTIGKDIVLKENKPVLDDITVGLYLEKHPRLKDKYEQYGGYETIHRLIDFVETANIDGYLMELDKWQKAIRLHNIGFLPETVLSKIHDIDAEELYNYYEAHINNIFMSNTKGSKIKAYNAMEDVVCLVDKWDKGLNIGFPIDSDMLNREINGCPLGNITLLGATSGAGKTTLTIRWLMPKIIEHKERIVMVINEQDQEKFKQELVIWAANNVFNSELNKKRLLEGKFTPEEKEVILKSAKWIEEQKELKMITVIPLETYTVDQMIKIIKKYAALGVKYFVLDTFKESDDAKDEAWRSMMKDMRKLYDVIKPASKNVFLWCTVQLKKGAIGTRYLTGDNIGMSKNIVDVCSTVLLMRSMREDEKKGSLKVHKIVGKGSKVPVEIDEDKNYVLIFVDKNRFGNAKAYQIVAESHLGYNKYKEIGICHVMEDY